MSLERFIALWMHPDYPPRPVSEQGLRRVEDRFRFVFPSDYRDDVLRSGLVSPTIDLLDTIVDGELDMADLSRLLDPQEIIENTESWREMGLPGTMTAFATDCGGNLFCFDSGAPERVYFFDHDFGTIEEVAPSFTAWIESFCSIKRPD